MKLTLGPVLYNWEPTLWRDFYFRIADEAPVDTVCVGEVVCSKRLPFFQDLVPEVAERLTNAGKEVLLSSQALVTLERERKQTRSLAREPSHGVLRGSILRLTAVGHVPVRLLADKQNRVAFALLGALIELVLEQEPSDCRRQWPCDLVR